ncbi:MAG: WxL domain-containing protein [Kurthia sp.]|nr:WxL domain-containing protein [Candidatus Kurthia equi]
MKNLATATCAIAGVLLSIGMTAQANGANEEGFYDTSGDVTFKASNNLEKPVHPENPDPSNPVEPSNPVDPEKPIQEGTSGPLSIDFVSNFQFGEQIISTDDEIYYAQPQTYKSGQQQSANYVQVTDKRGTSDGWSLSVKQQADFTAQSETTYKTLEGVEIKLAADKGKVNSSSDSTKPVTKEVILTGADSSAEIMRAERLAGTGTWTSTIGELIENPTIEKREEMPFVNSGVELSVPGETQKDAVTYATTLQWTLSQIP